MKTLTNFLFSFRFMAFLLIAFALTIASATFIESKYGTPYVHAMVYQSNWFALLLIVWFINLLGIIINNKLYRKDKFPVFILHVSF